MFGVNCLHPILIPAHYKDSDEKYGIFVGCNHCPLCTKARRREWSLRAILESQEYDPDQIAFATLTYDDEHLPKFIASCRPPFREQKTLFEMDTRNWMKRLRKRLTYPIRQMLVGEYGTKFGRPHYHVILFGLARKDWHFIEETWKKGFVLVKEWYQETCGYVAGYVQKKLFGTDAYDSQCPPFMRCSQKPSLGERYFWKNADLICKQGFIIYDGYKYGIPRTFLRKGVEAGLIRASDLDEMQLIQAVKNQEFLEHLEAQGAELSDYQKNLYQLVQREYVRMNIKRDNNEVF